MGYSTNTKTSKPKSESRKQSGTLEPDYWGAPKDKVAAVKKARRKQQGKKSQQRGKDGEALAVKVLQAMGAKQVEHIETPMRLVYRNGKAQLAGKAKVAGDLRAVWPDNGMSILGECKHRGSCLTDGMPVLSYTDLEPHQHAKLAEHAQWAISVIVWVSARGVMVLPHAIPGWTKGKRLRWDDAERYRVHNLADLAPN